MYSLTIDRHAKLVPKVVWQGQELMEYDRLS